MLTQAYVRSLLNYNAETGEFIWINPPKRGRTRKNGVAGSRHSKGYWRIKTPLGIKFAHRLAWIHANGEIPDGMTIDHINGDKADNRLENLRMVSHGENLQNIRKPMRNNTTGFLGVGRSGKRFVAVISVGGKSLNLGSFDKPEAAHAAYVAAKRRLHAGCTI